MHARTHMHKCVHAHTHTHTDTHTHTHTLLVMGWYSEKETTDQYAEEERYIFSFDLKEETALSVSRQATWCACPSRSWWTAHGVRATTAVMGARISAAMTGSWRKAAWQQRSSTATTWLWSVVCGVCWCAWQSRDVVSHFLPCILGFQQQNVCFKTSLEIKKNRWF